MSLTSPMGWPSDWGTQAASSDGSMAVAAGKDGWAAVLCCGVSDEVGRVTLRQRDGQSRHMGAYR
jgi:hypothetical protein